MSAAGGGAAIWGRAEQQDFRSRVRGCLLGGAIGDALGAGIEFDSLDAIREAHGQEGVTDFVPAYGRRGAVTDDTQMTLFTVDGLIRAQYGATPAPGTRPPTSTAPICAGPPPRTTGARTSARRTTAGSPARSGSTPAARPAGPV